MHLAKHAHLHVIEKMAVKGPPARLIGGDEIIGALSLRKNGQLFGRALADCTINDQTFAGQQCTLDLVLRTGAAIAPGAAPDSTDHLWLTRQP